MKATTEQILTALARIDSGCVEFDLEPEFYPASILDVIGECCPDVRVETVGHGSPARVRLSAAPGADARAVIGEAFNHLLFLSLQSR
jgi:hypothetical protein